MGTWGQGLFQNDAAADFMWEIIPGGWPLIHEVLRGATPARPAEALVCAELLTHALGRGRYDDSTALASFIEVHGTKGATPGLISLAERLLARMERFDYGWRDPKAAVNYRGLIANIRRRLGVPRSTAGGRGRAPVKPRRRK